MSQWPIAPLTVFFALTGSALSAQTAAASKSSLEETLRPGMTVWITDSGGHEEKTRIVRVSGDIVTTVAGDDIRRLHTIDIMRVEARRPDSIMNGVLIGAGIAVASGLFLCRLTETWENCRDDAGPMLRIGLIGAGAGIGIDALIRRRRTIFDAVPELSRLHISPIVTDRVAGIRISLGL